MSLFLLSSSYRSYYSSRAIFRNQLQPFSLQPWSFQTRYHRGYENPCLCRRRRRATLDDVLETRRFHRTLKDGYSTPRNNIGELNHLELHVFQIVVSCQFVQKLHKVSVVEAMVIRKSCKSNLNEPLQRICLAHEKRRQNPLRSTARE